MLAATQLLEPAFEAPNRLQILDHQGTLQELFPLEDLYNILELSSLGVRFVCGLIGISGLHVSASSIWV